VISLNKKSKPFPWSKGFDFLYIMLRGYGFGVIGVAVTVAVSVGAGTVAVAVFAEGVFDAAPGVTVAVVAFPETTITTLTCCPKAAPCELAIRQNPV
jgi:hypothetical protein